jgi:hypothetical protein
MAYTYKKLTDVELVESATEPNLLIEDGGDIKKISASNIAVPQVKADWNEEDENSPAFIMNKPDSIGGGGVNVITYHLSYTLISGKTVLAYYGENGYTAVSPNDIHLAWQNGNILRVKYGNDAGMIVGVNYSTSSGSSVDGANVSYYIGTSGVLNTLSV